jgi:hypothetical protein
MSLLSSIGSVAGGLIGGPAGSAIGGLLGSALGGDGKGSTGSGASPAAVADPFASQRPQYQTQLNDFMKTASGSSAALQQQQQIAQYSGLDPNASNTMRGIMNLGGTDAGNQLAAMTAPGAKFDSSDPSYQFRFDQGQQAVQRSGAAKGLQGSGNILMALQDYGQGAASQEYQAQFNRLSSLAQYQQGYQAQQYNQALQFNNQNLSALGQQFNQQGQIYGQQENSYQNEYARLAQLAGANIGSPGQAGQLQQQQQAGAAAFAQSVTPAISDQIKSWFGPSSGSGSSGSGSNPFIPSSITPVDSSYNSGFSFTPEVFTSS